MYPKEYECPGWSLLFEPFLKENAHATKIPEYKVVFQWEDYQTALGIPETQDKGTSLLMLLLIEQLTVQGLIFMFRYEFLEMKKPL